jgi:hypothetical protein
MNCQRAKQGLGLTTQLQIRMPSKRLLGHATGPLVALFALSGCAATHSGRADAATRFPAPVVASWATAGSMATGSSAPDTALWILRSNGLVEHREVRVRARDGAVSSNERLLMKSFWWHEQRKDTTGADSSLVICTSQRPSRNRQCGRVSVDTVAGGTRRLRWDGLTFRTQHWLFTER